MPDKEKNFEPLSPGLKIGKWELVKLIRIQGKDEVWSAIDKNTQKTTEVTISTDDIAKLEHYRSMPADQVRTEIRAANQLHKGEMVDRYRLLLRLGIGATCEVWLARDTHSRKLIALKIFLSKQQESLDNFNEEIKLYQKLKKISYILPLLEHYSGKKIPEKEHYWMSFPVIIPVSTAIGKLTKPHLALQLIVEHIKQLQDIMKQNCHYRDVKLEHLTLHENKLVLIDLGNIIAGKTDDTNKVNYESILKMVDEVLKLTSQTKLLRKKMTSRLSFESDYLDKTKDEINKWLKEHPLPDTDKNHYNYLCNQIVHYLSFDMADEALPILKQLNKQYPDTVKGILFTSNIMQQQNKLDDAIEYMEGIVKSQPTQGVFYANLGELYKAKQDYDKALTAFSNAIKIQPRLITLYDSIGMLTQQKRVEQKNVMTKKLIEKQPSSTLSDEQKNKLTSVFTKEMDILHQTGSKLLVNDKSANQNNCDSYATISWDQYFTDLSFGSYRTIPDGDRRAFRSRSWHYLLKNLCIINEIVASNKQEINILDIGCSSGYFRRFLTGNLSRFLAKRVNYWGIDIRKDVLLRALVNHHDIESGAPGDDIPTAYVVHNLENALPFKDQCFDYIVNFEVIKYLKIEDGIHLINESKRVLSPDGKMYISSTHLNHNIGFIENLTSREFSDILNENDFTINHVYGSQGDFSRLRQSIKREDAPLVTKLLNYYPTEIVTAMITPFYPEIASQLVYHCSATNHTETTKAS